MLHKLRCLWCVLFCLFFMNIAYGSEKYYLEKLLSTDLPLEWKLNYLQSLDEKNILFSQDEIEVISEIIERRSRSISGFGEISGLDEILTRLFKILLKINPRDLDLYSRMRLYTALMSIDPYRKDDSESDKLYSIYYEDSQEKVEPMSYELYSIYSKVLNKFSMFLSGRVRNNSLSTKTTLDILNDIYTPFWTPYSKSQDTSKVFHIFTGPFFSIEPYISKEESDNKTSESEQSLLSSNNQNDLEHILFSAYLSTEEKINILDKLIITNFSFSQRDLEIIRTVIDDDSIDLRIKIKISDIIVLKNNYEDLLSTFTPDDIKSFIFLSFYLGKNIDKKKKINNLLGFTVRKSLSDIVSPQYFVNNEEDLITQYSRFDLGDQLLKYLEASNTNDRIKKLTIKTCLDLLSKTKNFEQFSEKFLNYLETITNEPTESLELKDIAQRILDYVKETGKKALKDCICIFKFMF